ncbi:tautomerase family protein [Streptococcus merionis]|uniref:tautomerase family protein n=1 Tax=Streptococcus merionis TaxID=400065 RepID=UPI0026EC7799|nr:tautomerase family protein [Streptococcus merionis]
MSHIAITLYPGRSEQLKEELAQKTRDFFVQEMQADAKYFSVSIEEVSPENWQEKAVESIADKDLYIAADF